MNQVAYEALRNRAAWIDLPGRGKIKVTGEDRARLLHAMCTNHVQQLTPGSGLYAFFLNAQGRILADVQMFSLEDHILLDTEPATVQRLYDHLDKFIIADDAALENLTEQLATIAIEGPEADEALRNLGAPVPGSAYGIAEWGNAFVAAASTTGSAGYLIFVPDDERPDLIAALNKAEIPEADSETAEAVRLENGKPRYGDDFGETNIPQETQLMEALHFSKGCYLGQEIVERVRSRGHVNKLLVALEIQAAEALPTGTKIQLEGKDAGTISTSAYSPAKDKVVALGIVRAEAMVAKDLTAAGYPVEIRPATRPTETKAG